jgi:hypothetical protein
VEKSWKKKEDVSQVAYQFCIMILSKTQKVPPGKAGKHLFKIHLSHPSQSERIIYWHKDEDLHVYKSRRPNFLGAYLRPKIFLPAFSVKA